MSSLATRDFLSAPNFSSVYRWGGIKAPRWRRDTSELEDLPNHPMFKDIVLAVQEFDAAINGTYTFQEDYPCLFNQEIVECRQETGMQKLISKCGAEPLSASEPSDENELKDTTCLCDHLKEDFVGIINDCGTKACGDESGEIKQKAEDSLKVALEKCEVVKDLLANKIEYDSKNKNGGAASNTTDTDSETTATPTPSSAANSAAQEDGNNSDAEDVEKPSAKAPESGAARFGVKSVLILAFSALPIFAAISM